MTGCRLEGCFTEWHGVNTEPHREKFIESAEAAAPRRRFVILISTTKETKAKISYFTEIPRDDTEPHGEKIIEDTEAAAPLGYYKCL